MTLLINTNELKNHWQGHIDTLRVGARERGANGMHSSITQIGVKC